MPGTTSSPGTELSELESLDLASRRLGQRVDELVALRALVSSQTFTTMFDQILSRCRAARGSHHKGDGTHDPLVVRLSDNGCFQH